MLHAVPKALSEHNSEMKSKYMHKERERVGGRADSRGNSVVDPQLNYEISCFLGNLKRLLLSPCI